MSNEKDEKRYSEDSQVTKKTKNVTQSTKSYDKVVETPQKSYDKVGLEELKKKWYNILKKDGFKDIEDGYNKLHPGPLRFYNIPGNFWQNRDEYCNFFRVIGLYAHHCPNIKMSYKMILTEYAECGSIPKAIKKTGLEVNPKVVWRYLKVEFPVMLEFVNNLDRLSTYE